jgi:hypothetical protein
MEQLLCPSSFADCPRRGIERACEKAPVGVVQLRRATPAPNDSIGFSNAIGEVRTGQSDALHADVEPPERVGVGSW